MSESLPDLGQWLKPIDARSCVNPKQNEPNETIQRHVTNVSKLKTKKKKKFKKNLESSQQGHMACRVEQ